MMFITTVGGLVAALFCLSVPTSAVDTDVNPQLNANLKLAATDVDRYKLLSDSDFLYNFTANPMYTFDPGSVCNADAATFPILTGSGMTVAQLNLGPCAMLPPHLHKAMNLVVAISGVTHTYMFPENGGRMIQQMLSPGMMTVFPRASMHSMVNEGCTSNQLYSFLNSDDPGTLNVANTLWQFGPEIVGVVLPPCLHITPENWNVTGAEIPPIGTGAVTGVRSCLERCGLLGDDGAGEREKEKGRRRSRRGREERGPQRERRRERTGMGMRT